MESTNHCFLLFFWVPLLFVTAMEREMAFAIHHSIHHDAMVKAIAAVGKTGLKLEDLPKDFGRSPGTIFGDLKEHGGGYHETAA